MRCSAVNIKGVRCFGMVGHLGNHWVVKSKSFFYRNWSKKFYEIEKEEV